MTAERQVHRVVVVGASAGGVEALVDLVEALPPELDAPVLVVLHVAPESTSVLGDILDRAGPLTAAPARSGEPLVPGRVFVAPPDHHLRVAGDRVELDRGPKENGHRPAVDTLFRSAAAAFGSGTVGVVLSGTRDDGAAGLAAIAAVACDVVAPVHEIAHLIVHAVGKTHEGGPAVSSHPDPPPPDSGGGGATGLTCPECGGAIWEEDHEGVVRFACHVGHRYSPESMLQEQGQTMEAALWTAVRVLSERAGLLRRLAERVGSDPESIAYRRFQNSAAEAERHAETIRDRILTPTQSVGGEEAG